jgi:hypothetical protein
MEMLLHLCLPFLKHVCYHFILLVINLSSNMFSLSFLHFLFCIFRHVHKLGNVTMTLAFANMSFVTMQMHLQMVGLIHATLLHYTYILAPPPIPSFLVNYLCCCYSTIIPLASHQYFYSLH